MCSSLNCSQSLHERPAFLSFEGISPLYLEVKNCLKKKKSCFHLLTFLTHLGGKGKLPRQVRDPKILKVSRHSLLTFTATHLPCAFSGKKSKVGTWILCPGPGHVGPWEPRQRAGGGREREKEKSRLSFKPSSVPSSTDPQGSKSGLPKAWPDPQWPGLALPAEVPPGRPHQSKG